MNHDADLLKAYARGDQQAFTQLVERHMSLVYCAALRLTGDSHASKDVAQSVFTDLARKGSKLSGHSSLVGWLHTATRHAAANRRRGEVRRSQREHTYHANQDTDMNDPDWSHLRPLLDDLLSELPGPEREMVLLRYFSNWTYAQISDQCGASADACRMRVERGVDRLRTLAGKRGIGTSAAAFAALLARASEVEGPLPTGLVSTVASQAISSAASGLVATGAGVMVVKIASLAAFAATIVWAVVRFDRSHDPRVDVVPDKTIATVFGNAHSDHGSPDGPEVRSGRRLHIGAIDRLAMAYASQMLYTLANVRPGMSLTDNERNDIVAAYVGMRVARARWEVELARIEEKGPDEAVVTIPAYHGEKLLIDFGADIDRRLGPGMGDKVFAAYGVAILRDNEGMGQRPQTLIVRRNTPDERHDLVCIEHKYSWTPPPMRLDKLKVGDFTISGNLNPEITVDTSSQFLPTSSFMYYEFLRDALPPEKPISPHSG